MESTETTESTEITEQPIVTLTEAALKEVKRLLDIQDITEGGLRLGVKGGGLFRAQLYDQFR